MKEIYGKIQYKDREYKVAINLNVWQTIQEEYGTFNHWADITTGADEPNAKAVIFGIREMLNEGIDIDNEENGTNIPFFTDKQVGRLLTEVGLTNVLKVMQRTIVDSAQSDEKNA